MAYLELSSRLAANQLQNIFSEACSRIGSRISTPGWMFIGNGGYQRFSRFGSLRFYIDDEGSSLNMAYSPSNGHRSGIYFYVDGPLAEMVPEFILQRVLDDFAAGPRKKEHEPVQSPKYIPETERLFVYGRLLNWGFQRETFGRCVEPQYAQLWDAQLLVKKASLGTTMDLNGGLQKRWVREYEIQPRPRSRVHGGVIELAPTELRVIDGRQQGPFHREHVTLSSGDSAWTYTRSRGLF